MATEEKKEIKETIPVLLSVPDDFTVAKCPICIYYYEKTLVRQNLIFPNEYTTKLTFKQKINIHDGEFTHKVLEKAYLNFALRTKIIHKPVVVYPNFLDINTSKRIYFKTDGENIDVCPLYGSRLLRGRWEGDDLAFPNYIRCEYYG